MPERLDICIVEDDEDARASLSDILELDEHSVAAFGSVREVLKYEGLGQVDVILMDRKLPDGFAEEFLPQLKNIADRADIIVVTGYADMQATIVALREGVSDYLIKPVDPNALLASLARIAKRRRVENELFRQRRFAEKLFETAEAIVLVLDVQGRVSRANPYLLELTGYSPDEVIGADWFSMFIPAPHYERIREVFRKSVNQIKTHGVINPILTKDGRECEIRWSNSTLRNADGVTTGVLSVGLDVTDYVKAQRHLLQRQRLAAIGETMTGLAHESRNAVQRIQNAVELLQDELEGHPEALRDVAKIERAGRHIRDLLEEVRAFAAPVNLKLTRESIPAIWRRAWRSIGHLLEDRDVTLCDPLPDQIEEGAFSAKVDARRIEQVFRNLFENALDAVSSPGTIALDCQQTPTTISVAVRDNGPGVPESHRDCLFDAFATTKPTGTGLGLAICRRTLEAHGGQLQLLASDSGAAFLIELPKNSAKLASQLM